MCFAIPSEIAAINGKMATIDVDGVRRRASFFLLEDVNIGDDVVIRAGFAIRKLDESAARESLTLPKDATALLERNKETPDSIMTNYFRQKIQIEQDSIEVQIDLVL